MTSLHHRCPVWWHVSTAALLIFALDVSVGRALNPPPRGIKCSYKAWWHLPLPPFSWHAGGRTGCSGASTRSPLLAQCRGR
jgi:hypothetical protein